MWLGGKILLTASNADLKCNVLAAILECGLDDPQSGSKEENNSVFNR